MDGPERVAMIWDKWGGPLEGIADYKGAPHCFWLLFDTANDDWSEVYLLHPLNEDTLTLALEQYAIFLRWRRKFDDGIATLGSHPVLPQERQRFDEITDVLYNRLRFTPDHCIAAVGRFCTHPSGYPAGPGQRYLTDLAVCWTPVELPAYPTLQIKGYPRKHNESAM